ncbi:MAG: response regulator [Anaerolineae bacterium]
MPSKRILIVDDVRDWRDQLHATLSRDGYKVSTAGTFQEALELLDYRQPELVIVDLRLSPTDENDRQGMTLLEELEQRHINAVVITGYGNQDLRRKAWKLHCFEFIEKGAFARSLETVRQVVSKAFQEIQTREKIRARLTRQFLNGQAVGFPPEAAGYPLRQPPPEAFEDEEASATE